MADPTPVIRYPRPKILLVDLPEESTAPLLSAGFNVQEGTFGRPYNVPMSNSFVPVVPQAHLPNHTEQEIVIIDLTPPESGDEPQGGQMVLEGELDWYAKSNQGVIDPRPMIMAMVSDSWLRILKAGGAFVIFAQPRLQQRFVMGTTQHGRFYLKSEIDRDNWSFLPVFSKENIEIEADHGTESQVRRSTDYLERFLHSHQSGLEFRVVLTPTYRLTHEASQFTYVPLVENKYGQIISGMLLAKPPKGLILILPQVMDKVRAVTDLITNVLPELYPRLFPDFEGRRWVQMEEYEHISVLERRAVQRRVREEAEAKIAALDKEIEVQRERLGFLHGILTKSGEGLVDDLREVLRFIGFLKVETPQEEAGLNKQEDLQVHDRSPCLLLEVKGLASLPTESDTHQCTKYVLRRMKQWDRRDVSGVLVVNHQRNLPALDREQIHVFTRQQLEDAAGNGMGLTTTWDFFRLVRGMLKWGWPQKTVQDVLYGNGRLPSIPSHYADAGTVVHFYSEKSVLSIDMSGAGLRVGDVVGFLLPTGFFEEHVTSLQVNKESVSEAWPGQKAGHRTTLKAQGSAGWHNDLRRPSCSGNSTGPIIPIFPLDTLISDLNHPDPLVRVRAAPLLKDLGTAAMRATLAPIAHPG